MGEIEAKINWEDQNLVFRQHFSVLKILYVENKPSKQPLEKQNNTRWKLAAKQSLRRNSWITSLRNSHKPETIRMRAKLPFLLFMEGSINFRLLHWRVRDVEEDNGWRRTTASWAMPNYPWRWRAASPMISGENRFRDGGDEAVTSHSGGFGCGRRFLHPKVSVDLFKIIARKP